MKNGILQVHFLLLIISEIFYKYHVVTLEYCLVKYLVSIKANHIKVNIKIQLLLKIHKIKNLELMLITLIFYLVNIKQYQKDSFQLKIKMVPSLKFLQI